MSVYGQLVISDSYSHSSHGYLYLVVFLCTLNNSNSYGLFYFIIYCYANELSAGIANGRVLYTNRSRSYCECIFCTELFRKDIPPPLTLLNRFKPLLTLIAPCGVILTPDEYFHAQHKNHQHHSSENL